MFYRVVVFSFLLIPLLGQSQEIPQMQTPGDAFKHLVLFGRVLESSGSSSSGPIEVQLQCVDRIRGQAYTDSKGNFSINLSYDGDGGLARFQASMSPFMEAQSIDRSWLQGCELKVQPDGGPPAAFPIEISGEEGNINVGTLVLDSSTSSDALNTISANPKARTEFEKGLNEIKKGKLDSARQKFQNAAAFDSRFVAAWFELGKLNLIIKRPDDARSCFLQTLKIDPGFVPGKLGLISLSLERSDWKELLQYSSNLLESSSLDRPWLWLMNSVANWQVGSLQAAQRGAMNGVQLDQKHRWPQLEYVLGLTYAEQHDYAAAERHIENYLRLAPSHGSPELRQQLAQIHQLAISTLSAK
jgi:tetratricopeptide (TPR) repeat protein